MKVANAQIRWLGDTVPSCGATYSSVSHWAEQDDDIAWSLVAEIGEANGTRELSARIRFLVEAAPQHLLHPGSRFEIFEGSTKAAEGEVTSDAADIPWQPAFADKAGQRAG